MEGVVEMLNLSGLTHKDGAELFARMVNVEVVATKTIDSVVWHIKVKGDAVGVELFKGLVKGNFEFYEIEVVDDI
jgi:hypothetical protein